MHPIVSSIYYEKKNLNIGDALRTVHTFFTNNADKFEIKMYEKEDEDLWLNFIMQAMKNDVLMNSLGVPTERDSMLCLRQWLGLLLDTGLAIGCFKRSEKGLTLVAVDILFVRSTYDTMPETRKIYGKGYIPFQNYLKLIYLGHRRYWDKRNGKILFMTSVGLIVDPVYRYNKKIEEEMLRKRHWVAGRAKFNEFMTLFVGRRSEDLKYNYKLLYKLDKNEKYHEINFINDNAFEILFATRFITKAEKGERRDGKRRSRICTVETFSEPPESPPNTVFLTPDSQEFMNKNQNENVFISRQPKERPLSNVSLKSDEPSCSNSGESSGSDSIFEPIITIESDSD